MAIDSLEKILRKCRLQYEWFAGAFLKIQTKDSKLIPFKFNRMQKRLWDYMLEELRAGRPIRWCILKGRQMGSSTWIAGLFFWIISLRANKNAVVAAHNDKAATELFRKVQLFMRELPTELRPMVKINNRGHLYLGNPDHRDETPGLESQMLVETASNVDMGRAFALHLLWWSEFAMVDDPADTMNSVENALADLAGTMFIIETTAKGPGYFQESIWEDPDNGIRKIFICWVASDEYRHEVAKSDYFELYDMEHEKYGNEIIEQERIIEALREWYPEEAKDEQWLVHESYCRLHWRRWRIDVKCKGDLTKFKQEFPTIPQDAFLGSARTVFNQYKVSDMRERTLALAPEVRRYRFDLKTGEFYPARNGPIIMLEPHDPNAVYVVGADPSRGVRGGDPAAAVLLKCPAMTVAGYFNDTIVPDDFALFLYYWGKYHNNALLGVEANEEGGFAVNRILAGRMDVDGDKYWYPRLYRRDLAERVRTDSPDDLYGWRTDKFTKDIMITDLNSALEADLISIPATDILDQMLKFQEITENSGRKRTGVPRPGHDDLVIALCIAYQMATRAYYQTDHKPKAAPKWSLDWWAKQADRASARTRSRFDEYK